MLEDYIRFLGRINRQKVLVEESLVETGEGRSPPETILSFV